MVFEKILIFSCVLSFALARSVQGPNSKQCGKGEKFVVCIPCANTCETYEQRFYCKPGCPNPGCTCKEGLVKRKDGECVPPENCNLDPDETGDEVMQNPDLFEGDILGFEHDDDRNAVVEKHRVWPNGRIPYTIDPKLKPQESQIKEAMQHYADKTCIRFVPRTDETQYVKIFPGRGCYSHVGKTLSDQPLSLGAGCFKFGIIIHELGHAVGFFHEHSRSDRDDYLDIHYENIQPGMADQFVKLRPKQNQLLTSFDFDSVMLYGETVFSKSHYDGLKTMTAKDGRKLQEVTEKAGLSKSDIERITKLYKC